MTELAERFSKFNELKEPVTYPGMEPTNNLSEQVIREYISWGRS